MARRLNMRWWILWGVLSAALAGYFTLGLLWPEAARHAALQPARAALLPGPSTHGHHQIELSCETCHTRPFAGAEAMQKACMGCHGAALAQADDKHPASKFTDPRNAFRLDRINAVECVTCHAEHRPTITKAMGLTQPLDYCAHCHAAKDEMPPDHQGFAFDGCLASGCHNYHDNRALYEDFLLKHADKPALLDKRTVVGRELAAALQETLAYPLDRYPFKPLAAADADAPLPASEAQAGSKRIHADWLATRHAAAGVNCSGCHVVGANLPEGAAVPADAGAWVDRPATPQACAGCHAAEVKGFEDGLHGMRRKQGLSPMTPSQARLPMHDDAAHRELGCTSCHGAHRFDTASAAVDACVACHSDPHTLAYERSPHFALWQKERRGELPAGSGVSCATCHMPRERIATADGSRIGVQHNQSATLQPNEKMLRPVCMNCHGLNFSIDALADRALIDRNFAGPPARHVQSVDMALKKAAQERARRTSSKAD